MTITSTIFSRESTKRYRAKPARVMTPADEQTATAIAAADAAATAAGLASYSDLQRRATLLDSDDYIIGKALLALESRMVGKRPTKFVGAPDDARNYLRLKLAELDHEVVCCMYLDAQHGVIAFDAPFRGTLTQAHVYPREIVKRALQINAAAVILAHNHPSGEPEPSRADEFLTQQVKTALSLVDVRVLDHLVVGGAQTVSLAERGLI